MYNDLAATIHDAHNLDDYDDSNDDVKVTEMPGTIIAEDSFEAWCKRDISKRTPLSYAGHLFAFRCLA